ncbi:MarR family winged helix-turn-helix transcriptional regulator [Microbacterium trichothecenolyticum]|uniref:DNA-binding transcriptional repressor MarR n=1 Tax=Microbacterium trichothecenolyticum TaxID=69370 RepID=A0A0M2H6V3_MICTR|nr:MarR family transcriptional regulator [Microbacterium trichothecenolyticum]KJL39793.1 DNA-binding transcriptional repressor MarR [Microbacterium trichothecenolyticum]
MGAQDHDFIAVGGHGSIIPAHLADRAARRCARTHVLWLVFHEGPRTQAELATGLGVTPRNVTTLVDGLEATGFARREPHPHDRRAVLVTLTDRGEVAMRAMDAEHTRLGAQLIDGLDDATAQATLRGLNHVLDRLSRLIAEHEARTAEDDPS